MLLIFRTLWKALTLRFRPPLDPLGTSVLVFRVWLNDLDLNIHMNNGRFLSVMDLGRYDLTFRIGLGRVMFRNRWQGLVGGVTMRYRRSLAPFERYELHTRLLGGDEKWFFLEQRFLNRKGELTAEGVVRALFRGQAGTIPVAEVLRQMGFEGTPPALPEAILRWAQGC
jgi:acyl-CoA thioesterase FadM